MHCTIIAAAWHFIFTFICKNKTAYSSYPVRAIRQQYVSSTMSDKTINRLSLTSVCPSLSQFCSIFVCLLILRHFIVLAGILCLFAICLLLTHDRPMQTSLSLCWKSVHAHSGYWHMTGLRKCHSLFVERASMPIQAIDTYRPTQMSLSLCWKSVHAHSGYWHMTGLRERHYLFVE